MNMYFQEVYGRIRQATLARTQVELAAVLDIRQSSISDAKRRGSVPADWYLTLFEKFGLNPDWLKKGIGPVYLRTESGYAPSDEGTVSLAEDNTAYGAGIMHSVPVPVYSCTLDSMDGGALPNLSTPGMISLPHPFIRPDIKVLHINSAAMEPTVRRNAYIGVDCASKRPISGELFAVFMPHEGIVVRRLYVDSTHDRVLLRADAEGHPENVLPVDVLLERLFGQVAWVLQDM